VAEFVVAGGGIQLQDRFLGSKKIVAEAVHDGEALRHEQDPIQNKQAGAVAAVTSRSWRNWKRGDQPTEPSEFRQCGAAGSSGLMTWGRPHGTRLKRRTFDIVTFSSVPTDFCT
jgi:hypothetical protein